MPSSPNNTNSTDRELLVRTAGAPHPTAVGPLDPEYLVSRGVSHRVGQDTTGELLDDSPYLQKFSFSRRQTPHRLPRRALYPTLLGTVVHTDTATIPPAFEGAIDPDHFLEFQYLMKKTRKDLPVGNCRQCAWRRLDCLHRSSAWGRRTARRHSRPAGRWRSSGSTCSSSRSQAMPRSSPLSEIFHLLQRHSGSA